MVVGGLAYINWKWLPSEDFDILDLESLTWIQGNFYKIFFVYSILISHRTTITSWIEITSNGQDRR